MSSAAGSKTATAQVVPAGGGAIVSRPELFERLERAARVTVVSAAAGSGKTSLVRSWIAESGRERATAWIWAGPAVHDAQRFWISVLDALRETRHCSGTVRTLTPGPGLDTGTIVERLLEDLASLEEPVWLVIDDVQELASNEVLEQLKVLLMRAPATARFVLLTRRDLRLGLHRLRLEGDLTEIRGEDLRFSLDEAERLFESAGVALSSKALQDLHERTEGWAAGLRLAALSLAGHPDAERFAADFSGSERTVAEYLLDEVLERLPDEVRRLLLRTSVLERVNGPLANLLGGSSDAEQVLLELERGNALVVALDARRSWFRYHHLFADLLQLELRRTAAPELPGLHSAAAGWFAQHGYPIEAVRHAQAAEDWALGVQILSANWFPLSLKGQGATAHELLAGFPRDVAETDPELAALLAADELTQGSLPGVERQLALAAQHSTSVPPERRLRFEALLGIVRLRLARQRANLPAVIEEARRLLAPAEVAEAAQLGLGEELQAAALMNLGAAEFWTGRIEDAGRHLERALALARQSGQPFIECGCLAHRALVLVSVSFTATAQAAREAIELAHEHGWSDEPIVCVAYLALGMTLVWQMRLDEAQRCLGQAQHTFRAELEPAEGLLMHRAWGMLELARGSSQQVVEGIRAAVALETLLAPTDERAGYPALAAHTRGLMLRAMLRLGQLEDVDRALEEIGAELRDSAEMRKVIASLRLAQNDPEAATAALEPVIDGSVAAVPVWLIEVFLLEAIARDRLRDPGAAGRALERALELAEPDGLLWPFVLHPAPELIERHQRQRTSHAALVSEILGLLAGHATRSRIGVADPLREPLSESETRVLRYLPTNLSAPEIASELYVAVSTVKTHIHHIYAKLGAHRRGEAVERARALGLLAPASRGSR